ncbi:hypothetical protein [Rhizobium sp. 007]|uniref:hypothetical protein n=1 Tax=Rhizobium sp. 007 TaxID=2785056 RepID=UPI0032B30122
MTANGKLDRKGLPPADDAYARRSYEAPQGGSRRRWPGSGPSFWGWSGSDATTTSSSSADTRSWRFN